ncbi:hypothetical protein OSH11_12825 [Kaistia dalseonensis]|uniref:Transposase n=1 Tax=Kaistia dalseonensis TaxID=410840 RepID=A0ABU0H7B9_9HYPH|nr:hypothetical protein [Kaistia dalseonensis]MCX5495592.1 hypothetical protein [Kaistia dalseonensis]MDQ0438183.1 hypothetical protein [Kaistia dalseonensis]
MFDRIFVGRADERPTPERIMIDAAHLKAHDTAVSGQGRRLMNLPARASAEGFHPIPLP